MLIATSIAADVTERRVDVDVQTEIGNPAVLRMPIPVDTRAAEERVQRDPSRWPTRWPRSTRQARLWLR